MSSQLFLKRYTVYVLLTWTIPPVFGLSFLIFIRMFTPEQILKILTTPLEPLFILFSLVFAFLYLRRFISPITRFLESPEESSEEAVLRCLRWFPLHYWGLFLLYLLLAPATVITSAWLYAGYAPNPLDWFRIHIVALIVSIIVGLPFFFGVMDLMGKALRSVRLPRPYVSLKTKGFLIGALIPLLIDSILVQYFWSRTGLFSVETIALWFLLELVAVGGSLIFVRSLSQGLNPLMGVINNSGTFARANPEFMIPESTDELGVLTGGFQELYRDYDLQRDIMRLGTEIIKSGKERSGLEEIVSSLMRLCEKAFGDNMLFFLLHDPRENTLVGVAQTGAMFRAEGHYQLPLDENSLAVWVFNEGKTVSIHDVQKDSRVNRNMVQRFNIRSALAAPLLSDGKPIGVLIVSSVGKQREYGIRERNLLEGMAREVAHVVQTRLHRDKELLVEQELGLAASVFRDTSEGILITDENEKIIRVNRAFTEITGYAPEEALGKTPGELLHSDLQDEMFYQNMWSELNEADSWQGEIRNRRKSGEIYAEWLNITASRDEFGDIRHYIGIFSDITE